MVTLEPAAIFFRTASICTASRKTPGCSNSPDSRACVAPARLVCAQTARLSSESITFARMFIFMTPSLVIA
jgi:hypothetical protein